MTGIRPNKYLCWLLALIVFASGGCTRKFFRKQADRDALALLAEKDADPRWKIDQFHVYPDPRARFADWTNPDRPPMPPDDQPTKDLSPNPQKPPCKAGIAYIEGEGYLQLLAEWDALNRSQAAERDKDKKEKKEDDGKDKVEKKMIGPAGPTVPSIDVETRPEFQNEMPGPVSQTGLLPPVEKPAGRKRPYLITLDQAVEFATINSREFQTQREALYLAALPLTLERFAFAAQFFATEELIRHTAGPGTVAGPQNNWASNATGGFSKLFSTGALLLVQFANQTVINLGTLAGTGGVRTGSFSEVSLDLVQPLLRGGGRAVTLEPLTQTERNLLYSVRDYARYRQQFYSYIAVGQSAFIPGQQAGVSALSSGTVQTPTAFVPFATPVAQGVLGPNVRPQVTPAMGGRFGPIPPTGANPQGYLNTLLQKAQLISYVKNVNSLEYFLKLLQVYQEGGVVNPVQVGQIEQRLLSSIETMLVNWADYRQALDLFRIQLGLPTPLPLELDEGPLRPMYDILARYEKNSTDYASVVNEAMEYGKYEEAQKLRQRLHRQLTSSGLVQGLVFSKEIEKRWNGWENIAKTMDLNAKLKELRAELRILFDRKTDLEAKNQALGERDWRRIEDLNFEIDLGDFEALLRSYEFQPWLNAGDPKLRRDKQAAQFNQVHRAYAPLLSLAVKERLTKLRESWPPLPPVNVGELDLLGADDDTGMERVVQVALDNRLDLMNQQAQLVDSWRKLKVAANALMGVVNVEYHMDSITPPGLGQPLAFSADRTRHDLVINTQLPLVRIQERNNYRSTLIAYQQQRRAWMDAQDQVAFAVRFQLRNLRIAAYNYHRVQKRAIELAYLQVDQALQAFSQPVAPSGPTGIGGVGPPGGGSSSTGDPAALTQQLLNTQNSLVSAQTDLYSQWLGYIQNRINLYRDLGLVPLDNRGVWIDDLSYPRPDQSIPACVSPRRNGYYAPGPERGWGIGPEELSYPRFQTPALGAPQ